MAGGRRSVSTGEVRYRRLASFHTVDEVAGMGEILGGAVPRRVLDRFGAWLLPPGQRFGLRTAGRVSLLDPRDLVDRRDARVAGYPEPAPVDAKAAPGTV